MLPVVRAVRFDLVIALKFTKALAFSVVEAKPPAHHGHSGGMGQKRRTVLIGCPQL
jgi:hypothetical protein